MEPTYERLMATVPDRTLRSRLRLWQRWHGSPMRQVSAHVPREGDIVDLGCGFGLFAAWMALEAPGRQVWGVDVDATKIERARRWFGRSPNLHFVHGDLGGVELPRCHAVVIYDVLHHLRSELWADLLDRSWAALRPGGLLIVKENDTRPLWKHLANLAVEEFAMRTGRTKGDPVSIQPLEVWGKRIADAGFRVRLSTTLEPAEGFFVPHGLIIAERT